MSSGLGNLFNTILGSKPSKPISRVSRDDHPLAQPTPIPPKPNPIPSAQPAVPPKRQNSYAGGVDPKIGTPRTRRVSDMGTAGNAEKFSSNGEGGGWDDRAESRLAGQERIQEERNVESRRKIEKQRIQIRVLKEDKEELKRKVHALQVQAREADTTYKRLFEQNKALIDENQRLLSDIRSITSDVATKEQATVRRITEIENRGQQQEDEIRNLRQQIRQSDEKQVNTDRLLQARTADLKGVETFLTTADEYSGAEIMMMVESLNGEIFQISAFMAETLESESQAAAPEEHAKNITYFRKALDIARKHIGASLFSHLKDNAAKVRADALPLQLGLQALLTTWCTITVRAWIASAFDGDLQILYHHVRNSNGQSIAGRWRAITCAQTRTLSNVVQQNRVMDTLLGLMCLCEWSTSGPESQKVAGSLRQMIARIEDMCIRLKRATKEGITNTDMEVFIVEAGKQFDESMEDMYADALGKKPVENVERRRREKTLCTVSMGLRKTSAKRIEGQKPSIQTDVLIKPKVALASVLLDGEEGGMIGEPRPRSQYFGK
ncbi:hypothetical protein M413DRAFT_31264 [Hebeloma cylindrosporum]|uniref:Uncharacterized protein n=1 Tax=Hebeloma cylindrosporum TaxID=76867 RepID=A0A0C3BZJ0_HEBCY|nr:hypothetical protein M413DRAFT_31264 [Hebeloma cylindrosporum h7]